MTRRPFLDAEALEAKLKQLVGERRGDDDPVVVRMGARLLRTLFEQAVLLARIQGHPHLVNVVAALDTDLEHGPPPGVPPATAAARAEMLGTLFDLLSGYDYAEYCEAHAEDKPRVVPRAAGARARRRALRLVKDDG